MTFAAFRELAHRATARGESALVPVWRDYLLDTETPVAVFAKLREPPFAFLLESAPAGGETWARYTFLGTAPRSAWRLRDGAIEDWDPDRGWHGLRRPSDPLADLNARLRRHSPVVVPELGDFWSGAVGFFGYDVVRYIERLPHPPARAAALANIPDALFVFTSALVIIDNLRGQARIVVPHDFSSTSLYRALRVINPSPYMYHLVMDGLEIVGSSPELLVRVERGRVTVRPIAGTRPRGRNADEDEALMAELSADEKERAEHVMLVDLGRNDVGRIAKYGSVNVTELMVVERYSHVFHLVSQVEGELRDGLTAMDALRATFPAGTMTGAPKVRAMEIIDELEPERRAAYAGAIGYVAAGAQRMDLALPLRTWVVGNGTGAV